jgi:hypothetical protein
MAGSLLSPSCNDGFEDGDAIQLEPRMKARMTFAGTSGKMTLSLFL